MPSLASPPGNSTPLYSRPECSFRRVDVFPSKVRQQFDALQQILHPANRIFNRTDAPRPAALIRLRCTTARISRLDRPALFPHRVDVFPSKVRQQFDALQEILHPANRIFNRTDSPRRAALMRLRCTTSPDIAPGPAPASSPPRRYLRRANPPAVPRAPADSEPIRNASQPRTETDRWSATPLRTPRSPAASQSRAARTRDYGGRPFRPVPASGTKRKIRDDIRVESPRPPGATRCSESSAPGGRQSSGCG